MTTDTPGAAPAADHDTQPRYYVDGNGHRFLVRVTVAEVMDVKNELGVNLLTAADNNFALLEQIDGDPLQLAAIIWILCRDQAEASDYSMKDFQRGIAGDALFNAQNAFWMALCDFFPQPAKRRAMRTLIEKAMAYNATLTDAIATQLDAIDPQQQATNFIDSFFKSPAAPASTPGPTRSANCSTPTTPGSTPPGTSPRPFTPSSTTPTAEKPTNP